MSPLQPLLASAVVSDLTVSWPVLNTTALSYNMEWDQGKFVVDNSVKKNSIVHCERQMACCRMQSYTVRDRCLVFECDVEKYVWTIFKATRPNYRCKMRETALLFMFCSFWCSPGSLSWSEDERKMRTGNFGVDNYSRKYRIVHWILYPSILILMLSKSI